VRYRHPSPGPGREYRRVAISPDARYHVVGSSDGALIALDAERGRLHGELGATVHFPAIVRFEPRGLWAFSPGNGTRWSLAEGTVSENRPSASLVAADVIRAGSTVTLHRATGGACPIELFVAIPGGGPRPDWMTDRPRARR
jgi:hypothetical protein